ncbi:GyrI-like domain-containing protein [Solwaraspora sp. WMMB762]|uniref:GyrI-like domain-containing protein n=1 Tax=Solwaraspora sp. WMMB762 TaxID=3404120 RepID=UPI003B93A3F9
MPTGALQPRLTSDVLDPDYAEGTALTYLHGVTVSPGTPVPGGLDIIEVPAGRWVVIRTKGPHPVHEPTNDFSTATCELWLPVEPA